MAKTLYVDPAASGTGTGLSWTNAWTNLQTAIDGDGTNQAVAGDTVYCRGSQTAQIDIDQQSGSLANGYIKIIGCNASGDVDGTRYVINGTGSTYALTCTKEYIWIENVELKNATSHGYANTGSGTGVDNVLINCISHDNGGDGFYLYYNGARYIIRCASYSNTSDGFFAQYAHYTFFCCRAQDNGAVGLYVQAYGGAMIYCVSHNNSDNGILLGSGITGVGCVLGCVVDENDDDGILGDSTCSFMIVGNRVTDNGKDTSGYGIASGSGDRNLYGWNWLIDNDSGATSGTLDVLRYGSDADTNETSGTEGYTDGAAHDFNLTASATMRAVAVEIP